MDSETKFFTEEEKAKILKGVWMVNIGVPAAILLVVILFINALDWFHVEADEIITNYVILPIGVGGLLYSGWQLIKGFDMLIAMKKLFREQAERKKYQDILNKK